MLAEALPHDFVAETLVGLLWGDVIDAGMVVVVVIPVKVSFEIRSIIDLSLLILERGLQVAVSRPRSWFSCRGEPSHQPISAAY